jgi:hypothetical protein
LPNGWEMLKDTDGYTYGSLFLLWHDLIMCRFVLLQFKAPFSGTGTMEILSLGSHSINILRSVSFIRTKIPMSVSSLVLVKHQLLLAHLYYPRAPMLADSHGTLRLSTNWMTWIAHR